MQPTKLSLSLKLSPELREAQERLLQLRERHGIAFGREDEPWLPAAPQAPAYNWELCNAQKALEQKRLRLGITPASIAVHSREPLKADSSEPVGNDLLVSQQAKPVRTVTLHPTIVLAILRQHLEAPARIYFLLRAIDQAGQGWLDVEDVRRQLTEKASPLKVCGWKRLRQLLKQGEGIFWQRDSRDRLWLKGAHRIAYTLDCGRLQGFPVELPLEALLGGIQAVRAAFYGSFHAGRDAKPISRETLSQLSGVPERTQRAYDRVAQIKRQRNIAIGEHYSQENVQDRAWKQGRAVFHFVDVRGRQGRKNREYVAWHLPNSYQATYQRRSRGSRKRLNHKLADLLMKGITGNDERVVEKVFFSNGAVAAKQYSRDPHKDAYWRQARPTGAGDGLWHVMTGV